MTSLIFVHGTGGRCSEYASTFKQIEEVLQERRPDIKLVPCLWGDLLGAKLNAGGASIPTYEASKGGKVLTAEEEEIQLWKNLYRDPFSQMRQLGMRIQPKQRPTPGQQSPSQELKSRVEALTANVNLNSRLSELGIKSFWERACNNVVDSSPFRQLLNTAARPLEGDYTVVSQTIVAAYCFLCKEEAVPSPLLKDRNLRNEAVETIQVTLTQNETSRGIVSDWARKQIIDITTNLAKLYGNYHIKRQRGALMDATYPFAGDILIYQAKGQKIRDFIRHRIDEAQAEPPVVLMAHSLGGIACVDLLVEQDLSKQVDCLITVGSQAPFFYEIGALQSIDYGSSLPPHFPKKWLNIYDIRDYLSYIGESIFPGKIIDNLVDNRQPFPEAHGAYWATKDTWDAIERFLP